MSEWRPISEYLDMKKKPKHCAFFYKKTEQRRPGGSFLSELVTDKYPFGSRVCTMFFEIPEPPK